MCFVFFKLWKGTVNRAPVKWGNFTLCTKNTNENTKKLQKIQKGEEGDIFEQKGWGVRYGAVCFGWCPV